MLRLWPHDTSRDARPGVQIPATCTKTGGVLNPGASDTVTVCIGPGAASLNYGWHCDTVTFNVHYGTSDTARGVSLHVVLSGDADGDGIVCMLYILVFVGNFGKMRIDGGQ